MNYKKLGLGLGLYSVALGAAQIVGARRISRTLDAGEHHGIVRGVGIREVASGLGILAQPAVATGIWNRVAGDVMDVVATSAAARNSPRNKAAWGALALVVATAALDIWVAIGLDRQTGKTLPTEPPLPA